MDDIHKLLRPKLEVDGGSPPPTLEKDMILEDIEELTLSQLSALNHQQEKESVEESGRPASCLLSCSSPSTSVSGPIMSLEDPEVLMPSQLSTLNHQQEKKSVQKPVRWEDEESVEESVGWEEESMQKRVAWEEKESMEECVRLEEKKSIQKRVRWEDEESVEESVGWEEESVQKHVAWEEKESVEEKESMEECVRLEEKKSIQKRVRWEDEESVESVGLEEADRPASCLSSLSSSSSPTSDFSLRSSYTLSIRSTSSGSLAWTSDSEQGDRDECRLTDKELPLSSEAVIQDALTKRMKRGIRRIFRRIVGLFACCCCAQTTEEEA